jgi:oligopeptide transport system substrate-binding protein
LHWRMTGCTTYYGFNTTRPPFDNVKVRRAFAQAFDREQYVSKFEKGLGRAADQFVPPGLPGNFAGLKPLKFDAEAAKKELADAGFPNGKGLPEIKIGYVAGGRNQARADWLQAQLKTNLGIDLKADPQDARTYRDNGAKPQTTPQLFLYAWCQDYPDAQDWYSVVFDSRNTLPYRTFWKNDRYDQLVRAADAEPDAAKRAAGYAEAAQLLMDNAPAAFVDYSAEAWLVRPYVDAVNLTPLDYIFSGTTLMKLKILAH